MKIKRIKRTGLRNVAVLAGNTEGDPYRKQWEAYIYLMKLENKNDNNTNSNSES
jgi:hypothetical protein